MAFEKLTKSIKGLTDDTQQYIETTAEYYKLSIFKNGMTGLVSAAVMAVRGVLGMLFLVFLSIGFAIYLSERIGKPSAGYFIVAGIYFIIFVLVIIFAKKPMEKMLLEKYSKMAFNSDSFTKTSPQSVDQILTQDQRIPKTEADESLQ